MLILLKKKESKVIKELIRLTPTLTEEDFEYKENLGEVQSRYRLTL